MILNEEAKRNWQDNFNKLRSYKEQYGNCNVPINWKEDKGLSKWVAIQRNVNKKLPNEYLSKLKKIGFDFDYQGDEWEIKFDELRRFKKKFRNLHFPDNKEYDPLSDWLKRQIKHKQYLNIEQLLKLESLGILSEYHSKFQWEHNYLKLFRIKKKFGSLRRQGAFKNERQLNHWLSYQRKRYFFDRLTKKQIEKLEALGVDWNPKENAFWEFYNLLKEYVDKNRCLPTITKHKVLWTRINYYRGKEGKAALSPANYKLLKELGVFPGAPKKDWTKYFNKLKAYKKKHGTTYVRWNSGDNKLRSWVQYHRSRKQYLSKEKINLLDSIDFQWLGESRIRKSCFDLNFPTLKDFFEKNGRLPSKKKELPLWSRMRRFRSIKHQLSKEEIKQLDTIGVFETRNEKNWKMFFNRLKSYKKKYGTTEVINRHDPPLYRWVKKNRSMRNSLPESKRKALDSIAFCWIEC